MEELYCFPYGREFVGAGVRPEARYYGLACVRRTYVRTSYVAGMRARVFGYAVFGPSAIIATAFTWVKGRL